MTATINDIVEEWPQHFKPNKCKKSNLNFKQCKEKEPQPTSLKPALLFTLEGNKAQTRISSSTRCFEKVHSFSSSSAQHPEVAPTRRLQKVL